MHITFYISSAIAFVSTLMVITRLNAVQALLYLIVSLLAVALIFFELGAPFIAALEVIIYAGAIMVLFVFVMMMLNLGPAAISQERLWLSPRMYLGPVLLAVALGGEMAFMFGNAVPVSQAAAVAPKEVGRSLYTIYPVAVELAAMLLLAGLVGAYHLGADRPGKKDDEDITVGFEARKSPAKPVVRERNI